jgi:creatinine amidohydrolase
MRLQLSTWPDIEQYLQKASGIIVPIGSTEQHGPNGLIRETGSGSFTFVGR